MFKKATIYRLPQPDQLQGLLEENRLDSAAFVPVASSEVRSAGWSEVRDGARFMRSHGQILLKYTIEKKTIPGSAFRVKLAEKVAALAEEQDFVPGRKQRIELKERLIDELLPTTLPGRTVTGVWIDAIRGMIVIDSTSANVVDSITSSLIRDLGLDITGLEKWPNKMMGAWLTSETDPITGYYMPPTGYTVDDAAVLEYLGERGTKVTFKKADLDAAKVKIHVAEGAIVTEVAMTFEDRISFTLMAGAQLKGIKALDILKDNQVERDADHFENDFILMTLELGRLIDSLIANA